jgi:MoaA/NifB/PqqE/SkfB family radical SAM enzyme
MDYIDPVEECWPVFMEIHPSYRCNLGCEWCSCANCKTGELLKLDPFKKFTADFRRLGGKAVGFSGGGEPTLHPDFDSMLAHATEVGLQVGLITNGTFPKTLRDTIAERCEWVRVSLDYMSDEQFQKHKQTNIKLGVVTNNIMSLHRMGCRVGVSVNVTDDHDWVDAKDIIETMRDHVAYIQFRPSFTQDRWNVKVFDYLDSRYSQDPKVSTSPQHTEAFENNTFYDFQQCDGHFFSPVLNAKGDLTVCCYFPGNDMFTFGNIYEATFSEIWLGTKRQQVIDWIRRMDYSKICPKCCKHRMINKFLDQLRNPGKDVNFL